MKWRVSSVLLFSFQLAFTASAEPKHQVGDRLKLGLYKEGYEVVNHIQLDVTLPRDANAEESFFLCKPERCLAARQKYFQLGVEAQRLAVEERYQKKLQTLENQGKANAKELARAQGERDQALTTVNRLIEVLAQLKPSEGSAIYRRAAQLFSEGKSDEALAGLDQAKLQRERERARAAKDAAEKELESVAEGFVLRGDLLALQFRFDEAEQAYEEAVTTSPESFDAAFALALFAQTQRRYEMARLAYERCLALARKQSEPASVALVQNNLGIVLSDQNRMEEARAADEEALNLRRELAKKNPEVYLPDVATTLHDLGTLEQSNFEASRAVLAEILATLRQMKALGLPGSDSEIARTAGALALAHALSGHAEEAVPAVQEALTMIRSLDAAEQDGGLRSPATLRIMVAGNNHERSSLRPPRPRPDARS